MAAGIDNTVASGLGATVDIERIARHEVDRWFVDGMDRDDLLQEARLAGWLAGAKWSPSRGMSPTSWARLHVQSQMKNLVKASRTMGRFAAVAPLRLDAHVGRDGEGLELADMIPDGQPSIVDQIAKRQQPTAAETLNLLADRVGLTPLERHCVAGVMNGQSYEEIGNPKAVDNALMRAKRKMRAA